MAGEVYHYTTTAHLPWIIETGELRPGLNRIENYPLDFLWATTNAKESRTSSAFGSEEPLRAGYIRLVRFTLPAEAFEYWQTVVARHHEWTQEYVTHLLSTARSLGDKDFDAWCCRAEPLPLSHAIRIDTRNYTGDWAPLERGNLVPILVAGMPEARGVMIGDLVYFSKREIALNGANRYATSPPVPYAELTKQIGDTYELSKNEDGTIRQRGFD